MNKVKVAIIGGGIIGCNVAYYLSQRNEYNVTLFERLGILGNWETNNSVAMVMHQTGSEIENDDNDFFNILSEHILKRTPALKDDKMARSWTGIRSYGKDEMPIIEHSKIVKGLIHCCGMSGFGITIAPACGMKVVELIINSKGDTN
jgi:glycine/D-amino acid oxidase-like deaminating enzyme